MQFSCCGQENSSGTHSSEAGAAPGRRGCLWNQSQLAAAAWCLLACSYRQVGERGALSKEQRAVCPAARLLRKGPVLSAEGRRMTLRAQCLLLEENFSPLWNSEIQNTPSCCGHHLSWRWLGFEVPNLYVGPLACCAWNSSHSPSDSSY